MRSWSNGLTEWLTGSVALPLHALHRHRRTWLAGLPTKPCPGLASRHLLAVPRQHLLGPPSAANDLCGVLA